MQRMLDLIPGGAHMSIIICDSFIINYLLMWCNKYQGNGLKILPLNFRLFQGIFYKLCLKEKADS